MENINERFKKLREACGKTQSEWGEILGIKTSGVSDIENKRRNVTPKHLIMLANWKEYRININWLENGGSDENMFIEDYGVDELSDYCGEISEGKDPFIAEMLLKYKRLSPIHKKAIWEIYEEWTKKKED